MWRAAFASLAPDIKVAALIEALLGPGLREQAGGTSINYEMVPIRPIDEAL